MNKEFKFDIALKQGAGLVTKAAGGESNKSEYYLVGEATNSEIDKDGEFLSKEFLQKAAPTMIGITAFFEHDSRIDKSIGVVTNAEYTKDGAVNVEIFLEDPEDNEYVKKILKKIEHGIKIGFSIGGRIYGTKTHKDSKGNTVVELVDGEIYEVSAVGIPANYTTYAEAVSKAFSGEREKGWLEDTLDSFEDVVEVNSMFAAIERAYWLYADLAGEILIWSGGTKEEKLAMFDDLTKRFTAIVSDLLTAYDSAKANL